MKKLFVFIAMLLLFSNVFSQTQITLTFIGKDSVTQNLISLDSVYVKNLIEECDTLLYGSAPVLALMANWPVGIGEKNARSEGSFILKQNYPNPFQGSTVVNIYREYGGPLNLKLIDGLGTKLAEYKNVFEKGIHSFVISSSEKKVLILSVSDDRNNGSIKIISVGQGKANNTIKYLGYIPTVKNNNLKNQNNSGFIFYLGNQLMYTAHSNGYNEKILIDSPATDTTYYFNMAMFYVPTVTTSPVTNITQTTASSGGNVTSDGGAIVTDRGVCWSTSPNSTTANSYTTDGSGTGTFVSNLTGLTENTLYYVRSYATNSVGTAYGNEVIFTTLTLPTVTTAPVTNLTQTTATCGGTISSDGGATVTARGVCWNTSPNPTTANSYTSDGSGTGTFVSNIAGLSENTLYYVRAYATNSVGTAYGSEVTFTTLTLPTVTTGAVTNITQTTAISGGNVTSDGGASVTERGVCWSTSQNPTTADNKTIDGNGAGTFTSVLSGLTTNTTYYVKAYATNHVGTAYGNELSFITFISCPGIPTVTYGGQTYNTVKIGTQCWLRENLNIGTKIPGTQEQTNNNIIEKYCYNDDESNCAIYGGLYQWNEMMQYVTTAGVQGICPTGWHIPIDGEWCTVTQFLDPTVNCDVSGLSGTNAGGKMKSTGTIEAGTGLWYSPNTGATNESGFTAVPAGIRNGNGAFTSIGSYGDWWSSSGGTQVAYVRVLPYNFSGFYRQASFIHNGYSVRCLLNQSSGTTPTVITYPINNITETSATGGGNVTSDGGATVTARGVCWNTSPNPTTANSYTTDGSGTGTFVSNLVGLTENTLYYVRSYASNSEGTAYGVQVHFTTTGGSGGQPCPGTPTVLYGGQTYNTVKIGTQCWLRENLNIGTKIPGTQEQTNNNIIEKYCYNDDESNCAIYGGLYQWNEMMQYVTTPGVQGICPTGWHIPTNGEWCTVTQFLDPTVNCVHGWSGTNVGGKMKSTGTIQAGSGLWYSPNTGATNESGFTAIPAGDRGNSGTFNFIGYCGNWWSSSESSTNIVWYRSLSGQVSNIASFINYENIGFSVRCLKD